MFYYHLIISKHFRNKQKYLDINVIIFSCLQVTFILKNIYILIGR